MHLSPDSKELIIINRKPIEKIRYILEADPEHLAAERDKARGNDEKEP
jgi:hypothetical protein